MEQSSTNNYDKELRSDSQKFGDDTNQLFSAIFENSREGMVVTDLDGNIISSNQQYMLTLKTSQNALALQNPLLFNDTPIKVEITEAIQEALNSETSWTGLMSHQFESGSLVQVKTKAVCLKSRGQRTGKFVLFVSEAEEHLNSKALLQESETHLRQIISNYPQPIIVIDKDHRVVQWNRACEQFIGLTEEEMIGTCNQWQAFYPSARPIMADIILDGGSQALMSEYYEGKYKKSRFIEGTFEAEDFFPHMGDNGRWLYFTASAIKNSDGEVVGAIESLIDITERKQAEAEVNLLNSELNQLIATYPQPILVLDKNHKITHWNRACEQVLGFSANEMIGTKNQWKPFYPTARPIMADMVMENGGGNDLIQKFYSGKYRKSPFIPDAYECEDFFPNMESQGNGRWLYFTASAIRNDEGEVIGAIESLIDISQRMQAESEVRKLNDELEQRVLERTSELKLANADLHKAMNQLVNAEKLASLGNLVAGVAHELNTPIGNIMTVSTTLKENASEFDHAVQSGSLRKSTLVDFMQVITESTQLMERSAQRAAELIGHFKQVAIDQTSVRRRQFDLRETVQETLTSMSPVLKKTNYVIENKVQPGLYMESYPGPIEQVLTNLINNSLLHGFENKEQGVISIKCSEHSNSVRVIYTDDGVGIPRQLINKAFDPFFTTKLGSGGSGLGLYIIYNLITAVLGGKVDLISEQGAGVKFSIELPKTAPIPTGDKEVNTDGI